MGKTGSNLLIVFIGIFICLGALGNLGIADKSGIYPVSPDEVFSIELNIDPGEQEIFSFQYNLIFDPIYFEVITQKEGSFLNHDGVNTYVVDKVDNPAGRAEFGCTRVGVQDGVNAQGTAAIINLKPTGAVGDTLIEVTDIKIVFIDGSILQPQDVDPVKWYVTVTPEEDVNKQLTKRFTLTWKTNASMTTTYLTTNNNQAESKNISAPGEDSGSIGSGLLMGLAALTALLTGLLLFKYIKGDKK